MSKKEAKAKIQKKRKAQGKNKSKCHSGEKGTPAFTADKLKFFHTRFKNGYDVKSDKQYNTWLKEKHINADKGDVDYSMCDPLQQSLCI